MCFPAFTHFQNLSNCKKITSSHSNMAEVGEEGGIWGAGARNYDNQAWGVTRQGQDKGDYSGNHGHHEKKNQGEGMGAVVARHYDNLPEKGRESRQESRIYHMRSCLSVWLRYHQPKCHFQFH